MAILVKETKLKDKLFQGIPYFIILIVSLLLYLDSGLFSYGYWNYADSVFAFFPSKMVANYSYLWQAFYETGNASWYTGVLPYYLFVGALDHLGVPLWVVSKIVYVLSTAMAGWFTYLLAGCFIGYQRESRLVAALFYMVMIFAVLDPKFVFGLAAIPLLLFLFIRGMNSERKGLLFACLFALGWLMVVSPAPVALALILILSYLLFYAVSNRWRVGSAVKGFLIPAGILSLCLSSFWILPALYDFFSHNLAQQLYPLGDAAAVLEYTQPYTSLIWVYRLMYGALGPVTVTAYYDLPIVVIAGFIIPIYAYSALLFHNKRKEVFYLTIMGLFFTTFATGVHYPLFSSVYQWLFEHVPYFEGFRNTTKFLLPLTLIYACLIGLTTQGVLSFLEVGITQHRLRKAVGLIVVLCILAVIFIQTFPYSQVEYGCRGDSMIVPHDYYDFHDYVAANSQPGNRVLQLPCQGTYGIYTWYSSYALPSITGSFSPIGALGASLGGSERITNALYNEINSKNPHNIPSIVNILSVLNIRYILIHNDIPGTDTSDLQLFLDDPQYLTRAGPYSNFTLLELRREYLLPHIYSTTAPTLIDSNIEALAPMSYTRYLDGKPVLLFTEQNEDKEKLFSRAKDFVFFNHKPSGEKILDYLKEAETPPTYFFSKKLSGEVNSWEGRSLKGSFYIPASGSYSLKAKVSPQYVTAPDYGLKEKMGRNLEEWSFVPKNVKYFTSARKNVLTVSTYFDGDPREREFLCLKKEIKLVDLEEYPNFEINYCLANPEVQKIKIVLGIDIDNDGKIETRISEQLPSGSEKEFNTYDFNLYKKITDSLDQDLPSGASFHLVKVYLKVSKKDGLNCSTSPNKSWYRASFKNFGLYGFTGDKYVKSRDYAFNERIGLDKELGRGKSKVILSRSFEGLDLEKYPFVNLIHQNEDPHNLLLKVTLYLDWEGDGKADERVIQEGITPENHFFNASELAKSEFPVKKHYYLTKLIIKIFRNPEIEERESSSIFLQHLQIYNEKVIPYEETHLTFPTLKIDQKKLSLTKSGLWYNAFPIYLKEGYHNLDALFPGLETKLDFVAIEPKVKSLEQRAGGKVSRWESEKVGSGASELSSKQGPEIIFQKINPTKYRVRVKNVTEPFWLVFSESFHPQWRAYVKKSNIKYQISKIKERNFEEIVAEYPRLRVKEARHLQKFTPSDIKYLFRKGDIEEHYLVNGYANAWYVSVGQFPPKADQPRAEASLPVSQFDSLGDEEFEIILYFWPQSLFYLGLFISGATFVGCVGYLVGSGVKKRKKRRV